LEQPVFANRVRKFLERGLVHPRPRLVAARLEPAERELPDGCIGRRLGAWHDIRRREVGVAAQESVQATAEAVHRALVK
jgi:hypothetical protein